MSARTGWRRVLLRWSRCALVCAAFIASPMRSVHAQENTAETLRRAVSLYQDLQVERALVLLRQVVSPSSPFEVSRGQRVEAYKYLGASLSILGQKDSALVFFRAALERDPFVDLDPAVFTPNERAIFAEAKRSAFRLGLRPVVAERIDPARESFGFAVVVTHPAEVRVWVRAPDDSAVAVLLAAEVDGLREARWSGLRSDGRIAAPGRYALVVSGGSKLGERRDSLVAYFDLRHEHEALEDTLPALRPDELLPERYPRSASATDVLKGFGVASAALALGSVIGNRALGDGHRGYTYGVAGAASLTGIYASIQRQRQPAIASNVQENRQRRELRARANAAILERNASRMAQMRLLLTPAAGSGR